MAVAALAAALSVLGLPTARATSYSVSLTAEPTALEVGQYVTLTMAANRSLSGTPYSMYLFDQTDPSWVRSCSGQTCSLQATQTTPGTHTYIAYIARTRADPSYPPRQTVATSAPVTVTWTAPVYEVSLEADRTWLPPGSVSTLTASTNRDLGGSGLATQIYDLATGQRIAACASGTTCTAPVTQLAPASHSYQAFVASSSTSVPPPDSRARSNIVTVTWSPLPDPSRPPNVGAGDVAGTVMFPGPVPPPTRTCAPTSFTFDGISASAWLNGSGRYFAGQLVIDGSGESTCENASTGAGVVQVQAAGDGPGGSLACPALGGTFARVATDVIIVVTGDCNIDGLEVFRVTFEARGEFIPTNLGGGVNDAVRSAAFAGAFVVVPA